MDLVESNYFQLALLEQLTQTLEFVLCKTVVEQVYSENNHEAIKVVSINLHLFNLFQQEKGSEVFLDDLNYLILPTSFKDGFTNLK